MLTLVLVELAKPILAKRVSSMLNTLLTKFGKLRTYALIGSFTLLCLFMAFTYFVAREKLDQFDFDMTVRLQDNIPTKYDDEFSSLSLLGSFEVTTVVFLILVYLYAKKWWGRLRMVMIFPLFHVVEIAGKLIIDKHPPPFMFHRYVFGFHFPSTYLATDHFSYPSGHVGRTTILVTIGLFLLWRYTKKWQYRIPAGAGFIAFWAVMLISRIVLAEHWTSDTLGGTLLGISMALLAIVLA